MASEPAHPRVDLNPARWPFRSMFVSVSSERDMRLADFIDHNHRAILAEWEAFAATLLPAASHMDAAGLRDHAEQMLSAISRDLRTAQGREAQLAKSKGRTPVLAETPETAAQSHARLRAMGGFTLHQLVAEYRALRASVLRLWGDAHPNATDALEDIGRFNEAIDQAIAESVDHFAAEVDRWRHIFLGVLGHDLRGPLNAIMMTSKLLSALSDGTPLSEHTTRLMRSGGRMSALLGDLFDYSRTSLHLGVAVSPEPVDLADVCAEEVDLQRASLPDAVIEFTAQGPTRGEWDPSRMKQLIANLITNAAKYGDPHGGIGVHLAGGDTHVRLAVENSGNQLPTAMLDLLFDPLRRGGQPAATGEQSSLGLGLFIVRQIAQAHGGEVIAESSGGKTTFVVTLPRKTILA